MTLLPIPRSLQPSKHFSPYPAHQKSPMIEQQAAQYFRVNSVEGWSYLPIEWTRLAKEYQDQAQWKKKWFGATSAKVKRLNHHYRAMIEQSDDKVFTIVQHARGLHFHKHISQTDNLLVFSCGGEGDIPLPLLCDARESELVINKRYLASFKGLITHPAHSYPYREVLLEEFQDEPFCVIDTGKEQGNEIDYVELMANSTFSFCPRGFGRTSFRLYEAFQQGSIPIYLFDDGPWLPFQDKICWEEIAIVAHYKQCAEVKNRMLTMTSDEIKTMQEKGKQAYQRYFSTQHSLQYVIETIRKFSSHSITEIRNKTKVLRETQSVYEQLAL